MMRSDTSAFKPILSKKFSVGQEVRASVVKGEGVSVVITPLGAAVTFSTDLPCSVLTLQAARQIIHANVNNKTTLFFILILPEIMFINTFM